MQIVVETPAPPPPLWIRLLSASWLFGYYRDRFLRRQRSKITITDYSTDWVEIEGDDDAYFSDLATHWRAFS